MRSDITESLNRDLSKISTWYNLCCKMLNLNKIQNMIVSRSRTIFPPHRNLFIANTSLKSCESCKILGAISGSKFTFERHICFVSPLVAQ